MLNLLRLREDIPLYGSKLTLAFVEAKLAEHRIKANTNIVVEGEIAQAMDHTLIFVLEPEHMTGKLVNEA